MRLVEGAKISQQLLRQAINDPDFTFGIEVEFFLADAKPFIRQQMTQGLGTRDTGGGEHFVKKLGDLDWHDVSHFLSPLGVNQAEIKHNHEIIRDRLFDVYEQVTGNDSASMTPVDAWVELKKQHRVHELITMLRVFPEGRMMGVPESQTKAMRDIVYDGSVDEIKPYGKLNDVDIALAEVGYEIDDYPVTDGHATRDAFYNLVAKDLSAKLGANVVYTTDSGLGYHVSNRHEHWLVTEDSSLTDTEKEYNVIGVELVSPIMSAAEGLEMLDRVLAIMNGEILGLQVMTTEQTGLHVNLGVRGKEIDPVKILVLSGDEYIVNKFDRAANINAASIQRSLKGRMQSVVRGETPAGVSAQDLVQTAQGVLQSIETDDRDMARVIKVLNDLKPEGKLHSINFQKLPSGYVEYRSIGNKDYHKRGKEIRDAILHMIGITYIATDPSAYRQEFLKKLYLMVRQSLETQEEVPLAASVGMIGRGPRGGYGAPIEDSPDTPYDGENYMTQYGFDAGSETQ